MDSWFSGQGHAQAQARQEAHLQAATSLAGALHATGDAAGAATQCQRALSVIDSAASEGALSRPYVAAALKQAAALRLAQVVDAHKTQHAVVSYGKASSHVQNPLTLRPLFASSADQRPSLSFPILKYMRLIIVVMLLLGIRVDLGMMTGAAVGNDLPK